MNGATALRNISYVCTKQFVIKHLNMKYRLIFGISTICIMAGFIAISQTSPKPPAPPQAPHPPHAPLPPKPLMDTVPVEPKNIHDFDELLLQLDKTLENLNVELRKPLPPLPPVEVEKMKAELEQALKDVDPDKIKREIELAMKDIDSDKIKIQLETSLAKVDIEKIKKEIERVKEIEIPKIEEEIKKTRPQIEQSINEAKKGVEKAKKEIEEYKAFENNLEKDGLIDRKKNYTIEHKDGTLTINGQVQPDAVYKKYMPFLEKHKNFKWKKDSDGININKD